MSRKVILVQKHQNMINPLTVGWMHSLLRNTDFQESLLGSVKMVASITFFFISHFGPPRHYLALFAIFDFMNISYRCPNTLKSLFSFLCEIVRMPDVPLGFKEDKKLQ